MTARASSRRRTLKLKNGRPLASPISRSGKPQKQISLEDNINMEVLKQIKEIFHATDRDGGGTLDMEEFVSGFSGTIFRPNHGSCPIE